MALPEQIRKQSAAVQELYQQMTTDNSGEGGKPDTGKDSGESTSQPAAADENTATNVAATDAGTEQKPATVKSNEDSVEHKYKTLQGMYNAEVPRLHAQNRELTSRMQQMEQLLATLSSQQSTTAATSDQPKVEKLVTDKDVEEYGESIDMMRKVSREEVQPLFAKLNQLENLVRQIQSNVVPQVQAVAQRQHMSAEQKFWADLTAAVPSWRSVNDDADFQTWLLQPDPFTGITRQTYLDAAQRELNADRVATFFTAWLEQTGKSNVAQNTAGRVTQPAASELEKQVAPGRARSAAPPAPKQGKVYTRAEIADFFDKVRAGKFKGRDAERNRIETDIFAAQREGRIEA